LSPSPPRGGERLEECVQFLLKSARGEPATEIDDSTAQQIIKRLRHEGRKLIEVFVLAADGAIDRYQERTRRKLGSNAVASRTWLCETATNGGWGNGRYIPEPQDAIDEMQPPPSAIVLVLAGAEGAPETLVDQLRALVAAT
jgi:hypothetical protein